jgi:hypothetical protein
MYRRKANFKAESLFLLIGLLTLTVPAIAQNAQSVVDNCCYIDRQCATNYDWVSGYNAYQNNQCGAPTQQRQAASASSQAQPAASEEINNCCFIGWQCNTNTEWVGGYFAFQANQCDSSQAGWQAQWRTREEQTRNRDQASASRSQPLQQEQAERRKRDASQSSSSRWIPPESSTNAPHPFVFDVDVPVDVEKIPAITMCMIWPSIDWCERRYGR